METGCLFEPTCAAGIIRGYRAKLNRLPGNSDYTEVFCRDERCFLNCEHYKIRINPAGEGKQLKTTLEGKNARRAKIKEKADYRV